MTDRPWRGDRPDRPRCAYTYPSRRRCSNTATTWGRCDTHSRPPFTRPEEGTS